MKSTQTILRAGFTLIELLVVISIIALLASIAVPTANSVMRKAKEVQAKALMTGLITGIKAYQTEYNRYPDPNGGANGSTADAPFTLDGGGGDNDLIKILHPDQTQTPPALNPRRVAFYDPPPAKNYANGLDPDGALGDPWSTQQNKHVIRVAIDYSGDGAIDQSLDPTGAASAAIQAPVISWCTGQPVKPPAENEGTDPTTAKYFLCSWK